MERALMDISAGTKDPGDVLQQFTAIYKDLYVKAVDGADVLDAAIAEQFEAADGAGDDNRPGVQIVRDVCPSCKADKVILKQTRSGSWLVACRSSCGYTLWLPGCVTSAAATANVCGGAGCVGCNTRNVLLDYSTANLPPQLPELRAQRPVSVCVYYFAMDLCLCGVVYVCVCVCLCRVQAHTTHKHTYAHTHTTFPRVV